MKNNDIELPPKEIKGLKIWCPPCRTEVRSCLKNGKPICKCENYEKLRYRISIYKSGSRERFIEMLEEGTPLPEAIGITLKRRREVKQGQHNIEKQKIVVKKVDEAENVLKLLDGMSYRLAFLKGERGFAHERCHPRSDKHCADVEKSFTLFGKSLIKNGIEIEETRVNDIGGQEVGYFHKYLEEDMAYGDHSYNRNIVNLSGLVTYLNKYEKQNLENHFAKVIRKHTESKVTLIDPKEFQILLDTVKKENGYKVMKDGKKRIYYYDFIKTAYKLALLCGIRREPLVELTYNSVRENSEGVPVAIISKNSKVNKIQSSKTGKERTIPTPITPQLKNLLFNELNYETNRGTDKYLIGNDSGLSRSFMITVLSKSFNHFWKQTGIKKDLEFSSLRKTFINRMQLALGDNARHVTGHASTSVMDNFYLSKDFFTDLANKENIFPELEIGKSNERQEEIAKVRENKQNDFSLER